MSDTFLGLDRSGNDNNWTVTNMTLAADQMVDSPTNNFATLNPIYRNRSVHLSAGPWQMTLSEGNLKATGNTETAGYPNTKATMTCTYNTYVELYCVDYERFEFGLTLESFSPSQYGSLSDNIMPCVVWNGEIYLGGSAYTSVHDIGTPANGSIIGMAVNPTTEKFWISFNGTWSGTGTQNPATGDGGYSYSFITSGNEDVIITVADGRASQAAISVLNFGQDSSFAGNTTAQGNQDSNGIGDFYYTPPSGFLALCTSNLPAVAVTPSEHFNTVLYTGDGNSGRDIDVGLQPDMVWIKSRNHTYSNEIFDSVRGVTKRLITNTEDAESTKSGVTAFNTDGFELGSNSSENANTKTYVAWNWKAASTASGTTTGSGDAEAYSARYNTDAGFSMITYIANGTAGQTIPHHLGTAPDLVIVKARTQPEDVGWMVYHSKNTSEPETDYFNMSTTDATSDSNVIWNDTAPTSSVFTIGLNNNVNADTYSYIAYCWRSIDGYSKMGSYTANNNADGTFIYTGFRPALVIFKNTTATEAWSMFDNKRDTYNPVAKFLRPSGNNADTSGSNDIDFLSNGVKARTTNNPNVDTNTYIYIAFAETPFKYSNAR